MFFFFANFCDADMQDAVDEQGGGGSMVKVKSVCCFCVANVLLVCC